MATKPIVRKTKVVRAKARVVTVARSVRKVEDKQACNNGYC